MGVGFSIIPYHLFQQAFEVFVIWVTDIDLRTPCGHSGPSTSTRHILLNGRFWCIHYSRGLLRDLMPTAYRNQDQYLDGGRKRAQCRDENKAEGSDSVSTKKGFASTAAPTTLKRAVSALAPLSGYMSHYGTGLHAGPIAISDHSHSSPEGGVSAAAYTCSRDH